MLGSEGWLSDEKCLPCNPDDPSSIPATHIKQPKILWNPSIPIVSLGDGDSRMHESKTHGPAILESASHSRKQDTHCVNKVEDKNQLPKVVP